MEDRFIEFLKECNLNAGDARISLRDILASFTIEDNQLPSAELQSYNLNIFQALDLISTSLGNSYSQIQIDLEDESRVSWAGTAHEIREILATMLRQLAPDSAIELNHGSN